MENVQYPVLEVALFRLNENATAQDVEATMGAVAHFLRQQPGFIRWRHAVEPSGTRMDIAEWASLDEAKAAAEKAMQAPECAPYFAHLDHSGMQFFHFHTLSVVEAIKARFDFCPGFANTA